MSEESAVKDAVEVQIEVASAPDSGGGGGKRSAKKGGDDQSGGGQSSGSNDNQSGGGDNHNDDNDNDGGGGRNNRNNNRNNRNNNRGRNKQNNRRGRNKGNRGNRDNRGNQAEYQDDREIDDNIGNQARGRRRNRNDDEVEEELPEFDGPALDMVELKSKTAAELIEDAEAMGLENIARTKKQDLIFQMLKARAKLGQEIIGSGVLEILSDGFGFLRSPNASYQAGPDDVYVSPSQIRRFSLRTGDTIAGTLRYPKDSERYFALTEVNTINGAPPEAGKKKVPFENLTALFPQEQLVLELGNGSTEDITARIIDLVAPFGKGQRGLIVSPPKAGKTMIIQNIAQSIAQNNPDATLIVLLIDERPEEVTDMERSVRGEVVSSTFDEPASRHVQVAEMVIEKAKRLVEHKKDVIVLLDSITRLARAYNTVAPSSGKVLTGGVDANALQKPKRFFGAARNVEEGGSLTIIATALVETGSKMDEVIYEEFKGTGNMEVQLERRIAEKRVFPAININRSGTRREELMMDPTSLQKVWVLRKLLHSMDEIAAVELLIDRMKQTKTNDEFFESMKRQ